MIKLEMGWIPFVEGTGIVEPGKARNHMNPAGILNLKTEGRSIIAECIGGRTVTIYRVNPSVDDNGNVVEPEEDVHAVKLDLLRQLSATQPPPPAPASVPAQPAPETASGPPPRSKRK